MNAPPFRSSIHHRPFLLSVGTDCSSEFVRRLKPSAVTLSCSCDADETIQYKRNPIADVIDMPYSGNAIHPTQKPVAALLPLIEAFSRIDSVVLDPFCGSGSTLLAAKQLDRRYLGIEMDAQHHAAASKRLSSKPLSPARLRPGYRWSQSWSEG